MKRTIFEVALIAVIAGLAVWMWYQPPTAILASPAPQVANQPRVEIAPKKLKVYKQGVKRNLNLPKHVQADPQQHVVAATRIEPTHHAQTVTTVVDASTGDGQTYVNEEPLPWLAQAHSGELRLDYGLKRGFREVGRLSVRQDLIQVKRLRFGIAASVDTDRDYFVGVGIGIQW